MMPSLAPLSPPQSALAHAPTHPPLPALVALWFAAPHCIHSSCVEAVNPRVCLQVRRVDVGAAAHIVCRRDSQPFGATLMGGEGQQRPSAGATIPRISSAPDHVRPAGLARRPCQLRSGSGRLHLE
eukprot:5471666-Prymnesium_polylepis.1